MSRKNVSTKKRKIFIAIIVLFFILCAIAFIIFKPKYELNKAVGYLKDGQYKKAYSYIESTKNEKNKTIIKELITEIFADRANSGMNKLTSIASESSKIIGKVNINNVDYTLDDTLNISVESLDSYIALEDEISKDMILDELSATYDSYFKVLKFIRENFYNVLDHAITDTNFSNDVLDIANEMYKLSNDFEAVADNYKFSPDTQDIYKKIKEYIN